MKELLKSKKFWTLVAAIVAALTAFFCTGCAAQAKINRSGVHIDTVRVDYIIRSNNYVASCQNSHLLPSTRFMRSFVTSTEIASQQQILEIPFSSSFRTPLQIDCQKLSIISGLTPLTSSIRPLSDSPVSLKMSCYNWKNGMCGDFSFLTALFLPAIAMSRRGGRRGGKPRPKIKNIPLGGSHL